MTSKCIDLFPLSKKNLFYIANSGFLSKNKKITGVGAIFFGTKICKKKKSPVIYTIQELDKKLSDPGGSVEKYHKNTLQTLIAEVQEETVGTVNISYKKGRLLLADTVDLTGRGMVMDTLVPRTNHIYRVFLFMIGSQYTSANGFSSVLFKKNRDILKKNKYTLPASWFETLSCHHIPVKYIKKNMSRDVRDIYGKKFVLRNRLHKILMLLVKNVAVSSYFF